MNVLDKITGWMFPAYRSPGDLNTTTIVTASTTTMPESIESSIIGQGASYKDSLWPRESDNSLNNYGNQHNFNENIVTTSVFIVMVLIFIGVLLIACCKVLIGCTARNFFTGNRSNGRHANMIYAINGQILGTNGTTNGTAGSSNSGTNPTLPPNQGSNSPPAYDALSVHTLPPAYQFEPDKDSDKEKSSNEDDTSSLNERVQIALKESLKHKGSRRAARDAASHQMSTVVINTNVVESDESDAEKSSDGGIREDTSHV